jgi:hypothetical protein
MKTTQLKVKVKTYFMAIRTWIGTGWLALGVS